MLTGSPFRRNRKPEVGLRVYTKPAQVASGSWSSYADSTYTVPGCARRCPAAIVIFWTVFTSRSVPVLGSVNDAPTTLDSDAPRMPDDVDPATLYDALVIAGIVKRVIAGDAPVNPNGVDPRMPVAEAPMTPGVDAPMIPEANAPAIPGNTAPRSGWNLGTWLGILSTHDSSSKNRNGCLSVYDEVGCLPG